MAKIFTVCFALVTLLVIATNEVESRSPRAANSHCCCARAYRQAVRSQGSQGPEGAQQMENHYPTDIMTRLREGNDYHKNSIRENHINLARIEWNSENDRIRRIRQDTDYVMNKINEKLSSAKKRYI